MSVEKLTLDLKQVREQFEAWRVTKTKAQQRIPAALWRAAVKLLDYHSASSICRELHLSAQDLYRHRDQMASRARLEQPSRSNQGQFLALTGQSLLSAAANTVSNPDDSRVAPRPEQSAICQFVLEHKDGRRLTISLPLGFVGLESLCLNLLRAER